MLNNTFYSITQQVADMANLRVILSTIFIINIIIINLCEGNNTNDTDNSEQITDKSKQNSEFIWINTGKKSKNITDQSRRMYEIDNDKKWLSEADYEESIKEKFSKLIQKKVKSKQINDQQKNVEQKQKNYKLKQMNGESNEINGEQKQNNEEQKQENDERKQNNEEQKRKYEEQKRKYEEQKQLNDESQQMNGDSKEINEDQKRKNYQFEQLIDELFNPEFNQMSGEVKEINNERRKIDALNELSNDKLKEINDEPVGKNDTSTVLKDDSKTIKNKSEGINDEQKGKNDTSDNPKKDIDESKQITDEQEGKNDTSDNPKKDIDETKKITDEQEGKNDTSDNPKKDIDESKQITDEQEGKNDTSDNPKKDIDESKDISDEQEEKNDTSDNPKKDIDESKQITDEQKEKNDTSDNPKKDVDESNDIIDEQEGKNDTLELSDKPKKDIDESKDIIDEQEGNNDTSDNPKKDINVSKDIIDEQEGKNDTSELGNKPKKDIDESKDIIDEHKEKNYKQKQTNDEELSSIPDVRIVIEHHGETTKNYDRPKENIEPEKITKTLNPKITLQITGGLERSKNSLSHVTKTPKHFKSVVTIHYKPKKKYICGGSIISKHYILSAASCFYTRSKNLNVYYFHFGLIKYVRPGPKYTFSKLCMHERYKHLKNDIALLKSSKPIEFNSNVYPIKLKLGPVRSGSSVTIPGWGLKFLKRKSIPEVLQHAKFEIYSYKSCKKFVSFLNERTHICAIETSGTDACKEIKGGPLKYKKAQIGIFSFGYACSRNTPNIFTKINYYIGWIKGVIQDMGARNKDDYPKFVN